MRNFLRHLTKGDKALADDLAQETFIQAYRGLGGFRGGASFSTWLLGIAHNCYRNARRRQRDLVPLTDDNAEVPPTPDAARGSDLRQDLAGAMLQLTDAERLTVHLGYEVGLSHGEIAALLDWPLGTVKTYLARSKDKLRHLLASWNPQI